MPKKPPTNIWRGSAARRAPSPTPISKAATGCSWWTLLYGLAVAGLLLWLQISSRLSDWVEERTHSRTGQVMLYVAVYVPLTAALRHFPLTVYEGFFREHAYGLSNQNFWQWLGDFGIGFALNFFTMVLLLPVLYAAIRRARETWWIWGAMPGDRVSRSSPWW